MKGTVRAEKLIVRRKGKLVLFNEKGAEEEDEKVRGRE